MGGRDRPTEPVVGPSGRERPHPARIGRRRASAVLLQRPKGSTLWQPRSRGGDAPPEAMIDGVGGVVAREAASRRSLRFRIGFSHALARCCGGSSCSESQGGDAMSTTRHIAVLMGSHPPSRFARDMQQQRPSEAAVLAALRAQRAPSEAGCRGSPTRTHAGDGRSVARHAGARFGSGTGRAHPRGSNAAYSDRDPLPANAAAPPSREIARTRVVGSLMSRRDGRQPSRLRRQSALHARRMTLFHLGEQSPVLGNRCV